MQDPADRTEVAVEDLVGLQMLGMLDEYKEDPSDDHIDAMEDVANDTELFGRVVEEAITTQFASPGTFARELGQNAKDAYGTDDDREIEYWLRDLDNGTWLEVRDHGSGMSQEEVFENLLIPYNSGKDIDPDKIGEHGIGWFSSLDVARTVEVYTGKDGETTVATLSNEDGHWEATVDQYVDETFDGTRVMVELDQTARPSSLTNDVKHHMGRVDPESADIMVEGEKVNILRDEYDAVGSAEVTAQDGTGEATLYLDTKDFAESLYMTQDGLFISEQHSPFDDDLRDDIYHDLRDIGYQFWLELPDEIGLTKGRDQVTAADQDAKDEAVQTTFDAFILDELLMEDEYDAGALDMKVAQWVDDVMSDEYEDALVPSTNMAMKAVYGVLGAVYAGAEKLRTSLETPSFGVDHTSFKGLRVDFAKLFEDYEVDTEHEPDFEEYYSEMGDLSEELMQRPIIDAVEVEDETASDTAISVEEMIEAHVADTLDTYPVSDDEGLYVDRGDRVTKTVLRNLEALDKKYESNPLGDIRDQVTAIYGEMKGIGRAIYNGIGSASLPERPETREKRFKLARTDGRTIENAVEKYESGEEYQRLIETVEQLDEQVSEATDLSESTIALHYDPGDRGERHMDAAHALGSAISFNIANPSVQRYLHQLREGELSENLETSIMELYLHEKAHVADGVDSANADHGRTFYRRKRELGYDAAEKIMDEENGLTVAYDPIEDPTDPEDFAQQIDSYLKTPKGMVQRGTRYLPDVMRP